MRISPRGIEIIRHTWSRNINDKVFQFEMSEYPTATRYRVIRIPIFVLGPPEIIHDFFLPKKGSN